MIKPATQVLALAGSEAMRLDYDRLGTEHLLLGLASEGGAFKNLAPACWSSEAVAARYGLALSL
jgi:hypothetical protein